MSHLCRGKPTIGQVVSKAKLDRRPDRLAFQWPVTRSWIRSKSSALGARGD
jgi:hypothetical protein